jgi:predicted amidohydrolase YtcJ
MFRIKLLAATASLGGAGATLAADADIVRFGSPIITVNVEATNAEAVAVKDGRIVAVGRKLAVLAASAKIYAANG